MWLLTANPVFQNGLAITNTNMVKQNIGKFTKLLDFTRCKFPKPIENFNVAFLSKIACKFMCY